MPVSLRVRAPDVPVIIAKKEPKVESKKRKTPDTPAATPSVAFIRLCRWTEGGSSISNMKAMCKALKIKQPSGKQEFITKIVEALDGKVIFAAYY